MTTLRQQYAGLVCDLDGVVYRGPSPVPHAVEALAQPGTRVVYATNNASRPPQVVADHLVRLGLPVGPEQVVTSSQAGAQRILSRCERGAHVLAVGGPGVAHALEEVGLVPVSPRAVREAWAHDPASVPVVDAVLQGYGADVTADDLAQASYAVAGGALWVATNTDATLPTDRGVAPGNGVLVAAVRRASGVDPQVAGKPQGDLYELAADRLGTRSLLGVGDRLDTDVLGAMAAGMDSLWVLTGVDDLTALVTAPDRPRPTWVAADLRALDHEVPQVSHQEAAFECDGWVLERDDRDPTHPQVTVRRRRDLPSASPAGRDADEGRRLAVLNAGLRMLVEALEQASGRTDPQESQRLLTAVARSVQEQAGLHRAEPEG